MLVELLHDNQQLTRQLRSAHELCEYHGDVATTSLIEVWIDENRAPAMVPGRDSSRGLAEFTVGLESADSQVATGHIGRLP